MVVQCSGNWKKDNKGFDKKGKLTDSFIDKRQKYYDIAIRSNSVDLEAMKKALLANFFIVLHQKKKHTLYARLLTTGVYKQDNDKNTRNYKPGPGLPDEIIKLVEPVYAGLGNDQLLAKCLNRKLKTKISL